MEGNQRGTVNILHFMLESLNGIDSTITTAILSNGRNISQLVRIVGLGWNQIACIRPRASRSYDFSLHESSMRLRSADAEGCNYRYRARGNHRAETSQGLNLEGCLCRKRSHFRIERKGWNIFEIIIIFRSAQLTVRVLVKDVNDNAPKFAKVSQFAFDDRNLGTSP